MANMPLIENSYGTRKEILMFPDDYSGFAQTFDATTHATLVATVDGRKIIKAGTIFPANDKTAKGVVLYDLDVTNGSATGTVIYRGTVKVSKIPTAPSAAALKAMTQIKFFKGDAFSVEPPNFVELQVTQTDPGFAGNTATNATKPATLETGAEIKVPLFINEGDMIRIDTRTGEYMERA